LRICPSNGSPTVRRSTSRPTGGEGRVGNQLHFLVGIQWRGFPDGDVHLAVAARFPACHRTEHDGQFDGGMLSQRSGHFDRHCMTLTA
jgi:hypothetical protein